jgi:hypothetical protein
MRKRDVAASKRQIGRIFVEGGHITEQQLALALAQQRASGQRLGEILVATCGISRLTLASVLEEQWAERESGLIKGSSETAALAATFERRMDELNSRVSAVETLLAGLIGAFDELRGTVATKRSRTVGAKTRQTTVAKPTGTKAPRRSTRSTSTS